VKEVDADEKGTTDRNGVGIRAYAFENAFMAAPPFTGVPRFAFWTNEDGAFINGRADLQFTLAASEDLFGVIKLRIDSDRYGGDPGTRYAAVGGGNIAVRVQQVFVDFRVPPKLPLWFRIGQQPVAIRPWIFHYTDAPGASFRVMIDPIKLGINGYYVKMNDPDAWSAMGGSEFYAVDMKIPFAFDGINIAPGVFFATQNLRDVTGMAAPWAVDLSDVDDVMLYWLGVNVDGGIGPVKMQVDFIYNFGEVNFFSPATPKADVSAFLINGSVSFVWQGLEVGVGGKYISGEDADTADSETFWLPGGPNYGSEAPAISGDFIVFDNGWFTVGPGWPGMGLIDGPCDYWYGVWNLRGFAYYQVLDWLRVGAQVGYIGDTVSSDNVPYAGDAIGLDYDDDSSIGWEMDFGVNLQIYKGLNLETGFGMLFPGKALAVDAIAGKPQNLWALQSRLMYFF
jgi:hypothetical protein